MPSVRRTLTVCTVLGALIGHPPGRARGDNDPAVQRGVQFLRTKIAQEQIGEVALSVLAMLKADVPPGDPAVAAGVNKMRAQFASGGYNPQRRGGHDLYEA